MAEKMQKKVRDVAEAAFCSCITEMKSLRNPARMRSPKSGTWDVALLTS